MLFGCQENKFDEMIGVLQDILIDPDFVDMQRDFCLNHCGTRRLNSVIVSQPQHHSSRSASGTLEVFDNVTENKLIYTTIFQQYTTLIGTHTGASLAKSPRRG